MTTPAKVEKYLDQNRMPGLRVEPQVRIAHVSGELKTQSRSVKRDRPDIGDKLI